MGYCARHFDISRDREALLGLWRDNLSDRSLASQLEARFAWLYETNKVHALRTYLVVHEESDAVVGCSSLVPHSVSVDGHMMAAAIGVDLAITREHRVAGPAVVLQRAVVNAVANGELGAAAFCFSYPNDGALPIVKRVGYKGIALTSHAVKPVRTGYKLEAKIPAQWLRAPVAFAGDLALRALDIGRLLRSPRLHRASVVSRADGRFDALYESVRQHIPVLGDRRAAFLNWRYADCPTREHTFFAITDRSEGALLAYAVYTQTDRTAILVDALALDDGAHTALFVQLAAHLRALSFNSIYASFLASPSFTKTLEAGGFLLRGADRTLAVYTPKAASPATRKHLETPESWRIFDGELDL